MSSMAMKPALLSETSASNMTWENREKDLATILFIIINIILHLLQILYVTGSLIEKKFTQNNGSTLKKTIKLSNKMLAYKTFKRN